MFEMINVCTPRESAQRPIIQLKELGIAQFGENVSSQEFCKEKAEDRLKLQLLNNRYYLSSNFLSTTRSGRPSYICVEGIVA